MLEVDAHGFDRSIAAHAHHHAEIRWRAGGLGTLAATLAEKKTRSKKSTNIPDSDWFS